MSSSVEVKRFYNTRCRFVTKEILSAALWSKIIVVTAVLSDLKLIKKYSFETTTAKNANKLTYLSRFLIDDS